MKFEINNAKLEGNTISGELHLADADEIRHYFTVFPNYVRINLEILDVPASRSGPANIAREAMSLQPLPPETIDSDLVFELGEYQVRIRPRNREK
jgi:hypothetical protein